MYGDNYSTLGRKTHTHTHTVHFHSRLIYALLKNLMSHIWSAVDISCDCYIFLTYTTLAFSPFACLPSMLTLCYVNAVAASCWSLPRKQKLTYCCWMHRGTRGTKLAQLCIRIFLRDAGNWKGPSTDFGKMAFCPWYFWVCIKLQANSPWPISLELDSVIFSYPVVTQDFTNAASNEYRSTDHMRTITSTKSYRVEGIQSKIFIWCQNTPL